jgi:hypothetical protein
VMIFSGSHMLEDVALMQAILLLTLRMLSIPSSLILENLLARIQK